MKTFKDVKQGDILECVCNNILSSVTVETIDHEQHTISFSGIYGIPMFYDEDLSNLTLLNGESGVLVVFTCKEARRAYFGEQVETFTRLLNNALELGSLNDNLFDIHISGDWYSGQLQIRTFNDDDIDDLNLQFGSMFDRCYGQAQIVSIGKYQYWIWDNESRKFVSNIGNEYNW